MDRLTALRVFTSVIKNGSFSAAARSMRLSNAAVSKNISELEAHLNVKLISRSTRSMRLTEAGNDYHQKVKRILEDLDDADDAINNRAMSAKGKLRVAAPMSFGQIALAPHIPEFVALFRDISLDLDLNDSTVDLISENFDVVIRGSASLPNSSMVARKLIESERVTCASPAYIEANGIPETPDDLLKHRCIIYSLSNDVDRWRFSREEEIKEMEIPASYRVNNSLAIRETLLNGAGIAAMPRLYVEKELNEGRLVRVLQGWDLDPVSFFVIFASGKFLPRRVRVFVDFVAEKLAR